MCYIHSSQKTLPGLAFLTSQRGALNLMYMYILCTAFQNMLNHETDTNVQTRPVDSYTWYTYMDSYQFMPSVERYKIISTQKS